MNHRLTILLLVLIAATVLLCSCGGQKEEPDSGLSEAQRDSVLGESALPGASAVKKALAVSDSAQARADRANAAANQ